MKAIKLRTPGTTSDQCFLLGLSYRHLQIIATLCNECLQNQIWPTIQFVGSILIICLLYILLVLSDDMPVIMLSALFSLMFGATGNCCLILDRGKCVYDSSRKVIVSCKNQYILRSKWWKLFFKSCQPLSIKVGPFHRMDRRTAPSFIRFILQRTFFLIVNTRSYRN